MDINEVSTTEDLWTPYKELAAVVSSYLSGEGDGAPYAVHTFEAALRRHKQTFLALFKHPIKSATSREEIKRGITEGVTLPSIGRTMLSKELVDEAIILSDLFNVNEYSALELLHTAQRQTPRHPGLPRGLLAVVLYYDGRRALVQALKELLTARDGVCWSIAAREDILKYVTRYADQLVADGLLPGVLDALRGSLAGELERLQEHRALPPRAHHARLVAYIEGTRKLLAGVVFSASAQRGLEREVLLRLIHEQTTAPSQGPTGALDEVSLALQMALLYALDLSVLHRREGGEELARRLPLVQDPELLDALGDELLAPRDAKEPRSKAGTGALALCQLALGLALAALRRAPHSLAGAHALQQRDEQLVDAAVDNRVFEYIDEAILSTDFVAKEEYYQRRLHALITDFIVLMSSKLLEMRVRADEAARTIQMFAAEGLAPPTSAGRVRTRLDSLLRCVERLYARDPLGLRHEYWLGAEPPHPPRTGGRAAALYKFVRMSGELVCAALLPGYLRALASLAVPRATWALLARRDALSAHQLLSALQRYHCNLRTDLSPFAAPAHAGSLGAAALAPPARPAKMLVRHEEVEAMIAALRLIAAVAREDAAAGAAICETLQWDAVNTMFGLMCCHIPIQLKAALCGALAALGGTPATAGRVWAGLEAAQLVADRDQRALHKELTEVECRMEEYPLTIAFLELLLALCSAAPLPRALGAGTRPAGLEPYVDYVLARVALAAPHRPYKRPAQKHQVLSLCFRLFALWLERYEPSPGELAPGPTAPPPGCRVLLELHAPSALLRLALRTLDAAAPLLAAQPEPGEEYLEECITSVLELLERALALERPLARAASETGRGPLVLGLSKLLLEPETGVEDRLTVCCRILQHTSTLPACAARAAALLARALLDPATARHLHACAAHVSGRDLRHCFVECLDAEEWPEQAGALVRQAKEAVLGALRHALPAAAPNLAHWLLGYQHSEDVSRSALHEPGVRGAPRTCLHAVLDLLDAHVAGQGAHRQANELIESCYQLLYALCARPSTSAPALRLLRTRDYFLSRHVKATVDLQSATVTTLSARSWVLRACACEVGGASAAHQHAAVASLLRALALSAKADQEWEWEGCLLRRCLSALPVEAEAPRAPRFELFHSPLLAQAIASCDLPAGPSSKRVSVSRLHALLVRELAALPAAAPQRALVADEIQKVLDYVTEVNKQRDLAATLTHYYDSWRQLTEIIFCVVPQDVLGIETKKNLIINALQDILTKIPPTTVIPQLGMLASGTVLLLLVNLRHCYLMQKKEAKSTDFEITFLGTTQITQTKVLPLKFILHKILSWIFVSGDMTQKLRVNLYGALLNFLNIVNLKSPSDSEEEDQDMTYVSRLDASKIRPGKGECLLKYMVIEEICYYGVNLYTVIGADCVRAGHDACKMVALACIDSLVDIDPRIDWIETLSNQGFLRSLIDSLLTDDEGLQEAIEPNPKSMRALYLYETKMALLIKMAGTPVGAECVLALGALQALAELRALGCHPDVHAEQNGTDFVPGQGERYRQVLIPALALCDALLTTLGNNNHSCVLLVMHLLFSNVECIDMVLRAASPTCSAGLLMEVEAITSVLARCVGCAAFAGAAAQAAERAARTRLLVAALLPRFQLAPPAPPPRYYKIVCNILTFTRKSMETPGGDAAPALPPPGAALTLLRDAVARALQLQKALAAALHQLRCEQPRDTLALMPAGAGSGAGAGAGVAEQGEALRRQLAQCAHAAAAALLLLWRMAQHARSRASTAPALNGAWGTNAGGAAGAGGVEPDELRRELAAALSDRFTETLLDTAETQSTQRLFLDSVVKDIKSMMQF